MSRVKLVDNDRVIGYVAYKSNLDQWDGHNMTSGSPGHHLGIGKLRDGRYYLCHGTIWDGESDYAEVVTEEEAKEVALAHGPEVYEEFFGALPDLTASAD